MNANTGHLRLLATSHALNHVYQLLTPTVAPAIINEYGDLNAGLLVWCFLLSYSLLPAVSGYLIQRFGRRNLLTAGFLISSSCFIAIGFVTNLVALGLLFFLAGAAGSTYHPSGFPILAETYPTRRGRTLGLHQTGGAIGSFVGPFVTGLLVANFAWRPTMMLMAIPGLVLAVVLWFSVSPEQPRIETAPQKTGKINLGDLKKYSPAFLFIVAALLYVQGQRGTDAFANVYFTEGLGIGIAEASLLYSTLKFAGLFSAPVCGRLSDSYGRRKVLITLVIVESVSLYAITVTPVMLLAVPCIIFGFAAFGLLAVGEALLADVTPEKQRAAIFGINLTVNFSPYIYLTPALFALAGLQQYSLGFIVLSVVMPFSIPILLKIKTGHVAEKQNPTEST